MTDSRRYWRQKTREVTEPAKIRIQILYKSIRFGFGFATQSQLVQFSQVKDTVFKI